MKVALGTAEISDEDRKRLADLIDGKLSARKASREEARDYILNEGLGFEQALDQEWIERFGETSRDEGEPDELEGDEDLMGDLDDDEDLLS